MTVAGRHRVVLTLDATVLDSDDFVRGVQDFFKLLDSVTHGALGPEGAVDWHVAVREGSNVIEAHAVPQEVDYDNLDHAFQALGAGIASLEEGVKARPTFFDDPAMRAIRGLGRLGTSILIRITVGDQQYDVSTQTAASVDAVIEARYSSYGSVEGRLEILSSRGTEKFSVRDVSGASVSCYIDEELEEQAYAAFKHRVSVWGPIKYRADGTPISVRVEGMTELGADAKLPKPRDVLAVLEKAK